MTGGFRSSSIIFGTDTLLNDSVGQYDMFTAKYDASGNVLWAKSAGSDKNDIATSVSLDGSDINVAGWFKSDTIIFDSDTLIKLISFGAAFIVKYDSNGIVIWAKSYQNGNDTWDEARSSVTDGSGNILMAGHIENTGVGGFFVLKYDPNGNLIWTKRVGQIFGSGANAITTDSLDNVIVTGYYNSPTMIIDTITLYNNAFPAYGTSDVFVAAYDASGTLQWAKSVGGTQGDAPNAITADISGNIILTGFYQLSNITFGSFFLPSSGLDQMFIAKLGDGITSIEEEEEENSINVLDIFPNPATGSIQITIPSKQNGRLRCEIVNVMGEKVYAAPLPTSPRRGEGSYAVLDVSLLAKGIYVVRVGDGVQWQNKKLVIE